MYVRLQRIRLPKMFSKTQHSLFLSRITELSPKNVHFDEFTINAILRIDMYVLLSSENLRKGVSKRSGSKSKISALNIVIRTPNEKFLF